MKKQSIVILGILLVLLGGGVVYTYFTHHPPRIISHPVSLKDAAEFLKNKGYLYQVNAVGGKGRTLTFQLLAAPDGMQIGSDTGRIFWVPTLEQTGTHSVEVLVSDERGKSATQQFSVEFDPTLLSIQAPDVSLHVAPALTVPGQSLKITLSVSGKLAIHNIDLKVADTSLSPTTVVVPDKTVEYVYTPESAGKYHIQARVVDAMGNAGIAEERIQVREFGMAVGFLEGIDAELGTHEKDPSMLMVGTGVSAKEIILPHHPDGREMLDFSSSVDFYFGYKENFPIFSAYQSSVACILLQGVAYDSVDSTQFDLASLQDGYAQYLVTPEDTVIFLSEEGSYYKLGNVYADTIENGKIYFDYERLQP